jgi:hypothetical protein
MKSEREIKVNRTRNSVSGSKAKRAGLTHENLSRSQHID